jgi:hypothetical protein
MSVFGLLMYILVVLMYTCAHFGRCTFCECMLCCCLILVVDVPICTYLWSRLFEIKAQVDDHVMCTCALFVDVHILFDYWMYRQVTPKIQASHTQNTGGEYYLWYNYQNLSIICDTYQKLRYHMWYHLGNNGTNWGNRKSVNERLTRVDKFVYTGCWCTYLNMFDYWMYKQVTPKIQAGHTQNTGGGYYLWYNYQT